MALIFCFSSSVSIRLLINGMRKHKNMCGLIAKLCLLMRAVSPVTITDVSMASSIPIDTDCQER